MSMESDRLAREADEQRARLDQTLENLKGRMSPGQIVDEAMGYLREGQGADMARNLNQQVRDNPLALGLIGAGAAWLLFGRGVRDEADRLRSSTFDDRATAGTGRVGYVAGERTGLGTSYASTPTSRGSSTSGASGAVGSAASDVGAKLSSAATGVRDAANSVANAASSAAGQVGDTASQLGASGRRAAHDAADAMSNAADASRRGLSDAGERIGSAGRRVQRSVLDTLQEEPLILGAVALAVGAAIGAALPSTRVEDEWLGQTRDGLRDDALAYGKDAVEKAGEVASNALQAGGEEAERQGLVPHDDGSKPVAEKIGDVVRTAADTARKEVQGKGNP